MLDEAAELGRSGHRLFESLHEDDEPYSLTVMILEAARIKDRLDKFDRLLSGDEGAWLRLIPSRGDVEVLEVKADSALQESRQQTTVLRQLISEIRRQKGDGGGSDEDDGLNNL
ncbi:hypothetical protein [Rhodococcus marinonascens]|uniref:hypothetical protein n=1 Tax=Rhodococcus marinonascens TaxID=38311 RepID=UPI0009323B5C|nr:hypothetical protein [Rhodococcus marinonascens]